MYWLPVIQRFREGLRAAKAATEAQQRLQHLSLLAAHRLGLVEMPQLDRSLCKSVGSQPDGFARVRAAVVGSAILDHLALAIRVAAYALLYFPIWFIFQSALSNAPNRPREREGYYKKNRADWLDSIGRRKLNRISGANTCLGQQIGRTFWRTICKEYRVKGVILQACSGDF
jgi:hypothetical protein